jgi:hypothetical protein
VRNFQFFSSSCFCRVSLSLSLLVCLLVWLCVCVVYLARWWVVMYSLAHHSNSVGAFEQRALTGGIGSLEAVAPASLYTLGAVDQWERCAAAWCSLWSSRW